MIPTRAIPPFVMGTCHCCHESTHSLPGAPFTRIGCLTEAHTIPHRKKRSLTRSGITPKLHCKPDYSARRGRVSERSCTVLGCITALLHPISNSLQQCKNALNRDHVLHCNLACTVTWVLPQLLRSATVSDPHAARNVRRKCLKVRCKFWDVPGSVLHSLPVLDQVAFPPPKRNTSRFHVSAGQSQTLGATQSNATDNVFH